MTSTEKVSQEKTEYSRVRNASKKAPQPPVCKTLCALDVSSVDIIGYLRMLEPPHRFERDELDANHTYAGAGFHGLGVGIGVKTGENGSQSLT